MRILVLAAAAALAATAAHAQRLDASRMTCAQARAVVVQSGAVILGSGPHIYDRFVAGANFCSFGETTQPGFIATRDNPACLAGGICYTPDRRRIFDD
jgi:hypothetical protein